MTRLEKRERMSSLIQSYQSSNQTQKDFCVENDINYSTFQFWLRKCRENKNTIDRREKRLRSGGFVPVDISASTGEEAIGFQIEYPNGVRIFFGSVPDMGIIRELLAFQSA